MNPLREYFDNNTKNAIHKWMHYFEIYDTFFKKYKNTPVVILEIGVYQGGSLHMWRNYFGKEAKIFAIDINAECKQFEDENTKIFIGSQEDRSFLEQVKSQIPKIDILIDDGGHTMTQQIVSFEVLYSQIRDGGIYLCEDLHTSYWIEYGGGYKRSGSYIEYSKNFIDYLHAWHSSDKRLKVGELTRSMYALHYYDSVLVVEKRKVDPPESKMMGELVIPIDRFPTPARPKENIFKRILRRLFS